MLEALAGRALAGEAGEEVLQLDAPEWPRVPDSLRRADGESIYRAHGTELYATRSQLSMEEQLLADAQSEGAPHIAREQAVALLGADLDQLEAQLRAGAPAPDGNTPGGLRLDQATAAFLALTSPRRAELIVGPAGTGKTYTAVRIADAWRAAGRGQGGTCWTGASSSPARPRHYGKAPVPTPATWSSPGRTTTVWRPGNQGACWPTATCCASRRSARTI